MSYKRRYKLITFVSLASLMMVALASCSHTKVKSSIDGDAIYAKSGDYTVTNGELWNELKWSSYDTISEKINEAMLADDIAEAQQAIDYITKGEAGDLTTQELKKYLDYFELLAFTEVFSAANIDGVKTLTQKEHAKLVQTFIDNVYIDDAKTIDANDLSYINIEAGGKTLFADTKYEETYYMYKYYDRYVEEVGKKIFALGILRKEIEDHNDDVDNDPDELYYTDQDIIQYQKEHYQYIADRYALVIRFTNQEEIDSTFKTFGLKVYENNFYFIPQNGKTNSEYSEYYDDFNVEDPNNSAYCINLTALGGDSLVFELYVQMYNYIYSYRDKLESVVTSTNTTNHRRDVTEAIIAKFKDYDKSPEEIVESWTNQDIIETVLKKTQEDMNDISEDFKLYISKTLKINPDLSEDETRYSLKGQSYGDYTYMAFKVKEDELPSEYYLVPEDAMDDDNATIDTSNEKVAAYKAELIEEMMWDEIDDSYITSKFDEEKKDIKVNIFDNDIEILYSSKVSSYSKTHKDAPHKNTLLTVRYNKKTTEISINDIYDELERTTGTSTAIDLLSKKAIKDTEEYKETNENRKDYKSNIELLLSYFANNGLSGYDSSLGKYNFLKLYYHSTDIDKIVDNYYRINDASAKILTDYANNTKFYNLVQKYAKIAYERSFKITATNVLVYVDMDEDGEADDDFNWSKIDTNSGKSYKELAVELIQQFIVRMENSTDTAASALSSVIEEYQGCQRFTNGIDEYDPAAEEYDPTEAETRWAVYKRAGIYVKSTEYTDVSVSSTENSSDLSVVTDEIKERLHTIYSSISEFDKYPSEYVDDEYYQGTNPDGYLQKNGYGLLLVTSATARNNAEFKSTDDVNGRYKDIIIEYDDVIKNIENIYNSGDAAKSTATTNQIILFIFEYLNYQTSSFFPTSVQNYITDFIMPVYEKYTSNASQRVLLYNKMLNSTIKFENALNDERVMEIIEINKRSSDSYLASDDEANLFPDWWNEILKLGDEE